MKILGIILASMLLGCSRLPEPSSNLQQFTAQEAVRFRLTDWNIRAQVGIPKADNNYWNGEMPLDAEGASWWNIENHTVIILVAPDVQNWRLVVLHEFVHIVLESHKPPSDDNYDPQYEYAINILANLELEHLKEFGQ